MQTPINALKSHFTSRKNRLALVVSCLLLIGLVASAFPINEWYRKALLSQERKRLQLEIAPYNNLLDSMLQNHIALLHGVEAIIKGELAESGVIHMEEFESFSQKLTRGAIGIRKISVAPDGIVRFVYPLPETPDAIGINILHDAEADVKTAIQSTANTKQIVLSGPYTPEKGTAVFTAWHVLNHKDGFWGVVSIEYDLPVILNEAGISPGPDNIGLALLNSQSQVLAGPENIVNQSPVKSVVTIPDDGAWILAGVPSVGWNSLVKTPIRNLHISMVVFILLTVGIVYYLVSRRLKNIRLQQDTEDMLQQVWTNSRDGIILIDGRGIIQRVSPAASEILGVPQGKLQGHSIIDNEVTKMFFPVNDYKNQFLSGDLPESYNHTYVTDGDREKTITFRNSFIETANDGKLLLSSLRDITKQISLETHARKLGRILHESLNEIFVIDADSFRFKEVNRAAVANLGYSRNELLQMHPWEIKLDLTRGDFEKLVAPLLSYKKEQVQFQGKHYRKDKSTYIVDLNFEYTDYHGPALVAMASDVTDRQRLEGALRSLATSYAGLSGREFFEAVSKDIGENMDLEYVCIGELLPSGNTVRVTGGYAQGEIMGEFEYELAGTPCENVVGKRFCIYPEDIQAKFPEDKLLAELGAEGYVGSPLFENDGKALGIVFGLSTTPIQNQELIQNYFQAFIDRITSEISKSQTLEVLKNNRDLLKMSQEIGKIGSWELDLEVKTLTWTPQMYQIFGQKIQNFRPSYEKFLAQVHEDDQGKFEHALTDSTATEDSPLEHRIIKGDTREIRWVHLECYRYRDDAGNIKKLVGIVQDITDRKKAEKQRKQSENWFRQMFQQHSAIKLLVDPEKHGKIVDANQAALDFYGYTKDEMLALFIADINELPAAEVEKCMGKALSREESRFEFQHQMADGRKRYVEVFSSPIQVDDRTLLQSIIHDITDKKEAEKSLNKHLQKLECLYCAAPIGIGMLSDRVFETVNDEFCKMTGYSKEELIGQSARIVYPDDKTYNEVGTKKYGQIAKTGIGCIETTFKRKDGTNIDVLLSSAATNPDAPEKHVVTSAMDITHRNEIRHKLEESEERFRSLYENTTIGLYRTTPQGEIILANPTLVDMLGCESFEELKNRNLYHDVFHPDYSRDNFLSLFDDNDTVRSFESIWYREDGEEIIVRESARAVREANGEIKYIDGTVEDITEERIKALEKKRLHSAIEQTGETIVITDPDGTIIYVNPAFERISGYSYDEAVGVTPAILQSGEHDDDFYREMWATIASGKTWEGQFINRRKSGELYHEQAIISPVMDDTGEIVNYIAVKQDVTEKFSMENQLRQSQKMEAVGRLAGGVAHDFNNLLTVIRGYANVLKTDSGSEEHQDMARMIVQAAEQAGELTGQLLTFSRKQELKPQSIDPDALIDHMFQMLRRLVGEDINFHLVKSQATKKIYIDLGQFEQVLMNLTINARDAMPKGGDLTIETQVLRCSEVSESIIADIAVDNDEVFCISVSDTGVGMTEKTLEKIFEPFFTTKSKGKGTGLGLSTVFGIVKQSNGNIYVESTPGEGTSFHLYFPVKEEVCSEEEMEVSEPVIPIRGTKVLVLDDDENIVRFIKMVLEMHEVEVVAVYSGEKAIEKIRTADQPYDLFLTDVILPGNSGPEIAERATEIQPDLRVILMSGYTDDRTERYIEENNTIALRKPFQVEDIVGVIRKTLENVK